MRRAALAFLGAALLCGCPSNGPTQREARVPPVDVPSAVPESPPSHAGAEIALPPPPRVAPPAELPPAPPPAVPAPQLASEPPQVNVQLVAVTAAAATPVRVPGAWTLRDAKGAVLAQGVDFAGDLVLGASGPRIGDLLVPGDGATLACSADGGVTVGKKRCPGSLQVTRLADGRWRASIRTDLETYLEGVIAGELPPTFPRESMRAQAIVARTYVLSQQSGTSLSVDDTGASDQEFAGVPAEAKARAAIHDAVASTRGLVLRSGGKPLRAWYHSTCGGQTCPAGAVFTKPPAVAEAARATGLSGAPCAWCAASPRYRWRDMRVPADAIVKAAGLRGDLQDFSVVEQTLGGRATTFEVRAGGRSARVPAAELRLAVGGSVLRSTWIEAASIQGKDLVVSGRGWGHGVGMCQYGAKGLADAKYAAEAIVAHYYPGAELVRLW